MDHLLDLEKRTGIANHEIDDFIRKATAVEDAVRSLRDGTIDPDQIKIEGIETEEEKAEKEKKRLQRREELKREEEALALKRKIEEKERWWSGAELHVTSGNHEKNDEDEMTSQQANLKDKYSANYYRWDQWIPQDPATKQENELKQKEEEELQNKQFEENNKEFCSQFLTDMNERKKQTEKKQQTATTFKLKGNKYFKAKKYVEALEQYMEALKLAPFDGTAILTNIAQAQIQLNNYEDALEFLERALYLNPKLVKALSRKAHILGERMVKVETNPERQLTLMNQAIECVTTARDLEPTNPEITSQYQELIQARIDLKNEIQVQQLQTQDSTKEFVNTMATILTPDAQTSLEQPFQSLVSSLTDSNFSSNAEIGASFAVFDRYKAILNNTDTPTNQLDDLLYQTILIVLEEKSSQVYFRTNGSLHLTLTRILNDLTQLSHNLINQIPLISEETKILSKLIQILAKAVWEERPSALLLVESFTQLIPLSVDLIAKISLPIEILNGLLKLFHSLISINYQKSRNLILKQKELILNMSGAVCRLIPLISTSSGEAKTGTGAGTEAEEVESSIHSCCLILKDFVFSDDGKKCLHSQTAPGVVVAVFGSILMKYYEAILTSKKSKKKKVISKNLTNLAELSVEILLGCSQSESLRLTFTDPLLNENQNENEVNGNVGEVQSKSSSTSTSSSSPSSLSTVQLILHLSQHVSWIQSNGFAILMNITIQDDQTIRQILVDNNAVEICFQLIQQSQLSQQDLSNEKVGQNDLIVADSDSSRLRVIGLLSRLGTLTTTQNKLKQHEMYIPLIQLFITNSQQLLLPLKSSSSPSSSPSSLSSRETILRDECYHLIRLFASLTQLPNECLSSAHQLGFLPILLSYLPLPKMELNEITPESVILPPNETIFWTRSTTSSSLLVGNIARCLIPFADHPQYGHEIYQNKINYGVEKLICMMATCSDIRIRKNIAIILAKGCRNAEVKKKIENYRGLRMIVELQNQLN